MKQKETKNFIIAYICNMLKNYLNHFIKKGDAMENQDKTKPKRKFIPAKFFKLIKLSEEALQDATPRYKALIANKSIGRYFLKSLDDDDECINTHEVYCLVCTIDGTEKQINGFVLSRIFNWLKDNTETARKIVFNVRRKAHQNRRQIDVCEVITF